MLAFERTGETVHSNALSTREMPAVHLPALPVSCICVLSLPICTAAFVFYNTQGMTAALVLESL